MAVEIDRADELDRRATVIGTDVHDMYRYLTERVAALPAITHMETTPVIQTRKRAGRLLQAAFDR